MYHAAAVSKAPYADYAIVQRVVGNAAMTVACDWSLLRRQLLAQWRRLTAKDLDDTGPNRHKIAVLVQRKYGISAKLVENYLTNLERTLPAL